ncbi:MAG: amylo-alpha-1,6-glucosidase [archaeon]
MKVIHRLGDKAEKKEGEGSFLLTDKAGTYFSLGSSSNITHMQGLFHLDKNWNMYKSINNIYLDKEITEIENNFNHITRRYNESEESFWLTSTGLIYEVRNFFGNVNIDLDFRGIFDYDDKDRKYSMKKKGDMIVINYEKHNKFIAIKGVQDYEEVGVWEKENYSFDKKRNTKNEFYIYKALRIRCKSKLQLCFSFSESEKEAVDNAKSCFLNESILKKTLEIRKNNICKHKRFSSNIASYSLDSLRTTVGKGNNKITGVFAGLPWFHQFWSRDELISLKAFMMEERFNFVKTRLMNYLDAMDDTGRLPNRLPSSELNSADSIGWLFKRFHDFLTILEDKKLLDSYFSQEELSAIKHKLHFSIEEHMVRFIEYYIIHNEAKETWMDTEVKGGDGREGACIEIQALFLSYFKLMKFLCKHLKLPYYGFAKLEKMFVKKIKENFYKNGALLDKLGDRTIRPNVFIAYYAYPELLTKYEWTFVFNKALRGLWLEWGGLSTIEQSSPLYQPEYTGENNLSYHHGDSWFWINNLAAICLADVNKKKYWHFIEKIYHSSEKEMMYSGFIGHCSELSSAKEQRSEGCLSQAWSTAMFLELTKKIE